MVQVARLLNTELPLSKLIAGCILWIVAIMVSGFCGLYFTNHLLNVVVTGSAFCALLVIVVWLFFIKIHPLLKLFLTPALFLVFLLLLFAMFMVSYEIIETTRKDPLSCYKQVQSMRLGDATLVIRQFDLGATTSSSKSLELDRQVFPGIKKVSYVGAGGDQCDYELTRLDDHHIRCICTYYGHSSPEILSDDIASDL